MNSMIEELWYGNLAPCENCGAGNEETKRLTVLMVENEEILRRELVGKQRETFLQYAKWADHYACYISAQAFHAGFCLAAKLLLEAMQKA